MSTKWIPTFLRAVGEAMVRRETYLVAPLGEGISCKACGCLVKGESLTDHYQAHMRELDTFLAEEKIAQAEARKTARELAVLSVVTGGSESVENTERCYPNPCESCGKPIPRTGKRGRPPLMHDGCRPPISHGPQSEIRESNYTPEEQALLDELGL